MRLMGIKTTSWSARVVAKEELRTIVHESRSQLRRNQDMLLSVLDLKRSAWMTSWCRVMKFAGIDINDDWKSIERQLLPLAARTHCALITAIRWMTPSVCCAVREARAVLRPGTVHQRDDAARRR